LRAVRRDVLPELQLSATGMEFASEMVIKAGKRRLRVEEVPIGYRVRIDPTLEDQTPITATGAVTFAALGLDMAASPDRGGRHAPCDAAPSCRKSRVEVGRRAGCAPSHSCCRLHRRGPREPNPACPFARCDSDGMRPRAARPSTT